MATAVTLAHDEDPSYEEMLATLKKMHAAARKERVAKPLEARVAQLDKLEQTLLRNKDEICRAVSADFGHRSKHETLLAEVFITLSTLKYAREHLAEWMAPEERDVNFTFFPARAELVAQPLGVVGIISPWNYPLQLALAPLVGALAAGNRAIIKPSEFVPETAALLKRLVSDTFAHDEVAVVTGGPRVGQDFSRLPFDHLIFTGSTQVGKLVMKAAAENLTPVTLELGGKSPVIVGPGFPIEVAAERILHGKLLNAGQTCIAPDYVLLPKGKADAFVEACRAAIARMYPKLVGNDDYTSIISDRHIARLKAHLEDAEGKGGKLAELNPAKEDFDADTRKMAPVLVLHPKDDMTVMQEEIFGPVLPLRTYDSLDEAIDYVNDHPRPLALYVFDHDDANVRRIVEETVAGGVTVNETMIHIAQDSLPFGGVGPSGLGHYHGHEGFLAMSKMKPVVYQSRLNATGLMRPPYGGKIDFVLKMLVGK